MTTAPTPPLSVGIVVLAYQEEPWLRACIEAVLASKDVLVEVLLVDNGSSSHDVQDLGKLDRVRLLQPGCNLGYAVGCNVGAAAAVGDVLIFVNSDCVVRPEALAALAREAVRSGGLVTSSVRLGWEPDKLNSAGNPVHFLGFSWAGGLGQPASTALERKEVASVSGACFGVTRDTWDALGGFPEAYFAYHEDVELSLRCWLSGRKVHYIADAVVLHHYEFSRHPAKMYLLERNRILTWFTVLQPRTLALLLPGMVVAEAALGLLAWRQGWLRQKLSGWWWLVTHRAWILERRAENLRQRRRQDRDLAALLTGTFDPGGSAMPAAMAYANGPLRVYWWTVRHLL